MMALQMLLLLEVIVILFSPSLSYPVYGTKRYGRSSGQRVSSWAPYQMVRTQRYPVNYYELYPYSQGYPDDYYPQETYPVYYPPARTSKYEVYQAVLPYYYGDHIMTRPNYGYYDTDPLDIQEEMMQEAEREEREEAQPIGHELLYENEDPNEENLDDVNAAFLQNLIMSQMYKEALDNQKDYYDDYYPNEEYGKWEDIPKQKSRYSQEDEDVRELKQLVKSKNKPNLNEIHWFQHGNFRKQKEQQSKNSFTEKRDKTFDRKPVNKLTTTTPPPPATSLEPKRDARGQKEEVLMRPATPVRHPFSSPVLEMMSKDDERKRTPSVYDTIKHMLDMEKSLENKYGADEIRPHMKKRIIASEESLTHQLSVLKKGQ
ncbi:uncharacterized protein LOC103312793 isoform X1 [Tribolium castaneum]|uniref:uncharacterized protein LOC103312793 isoform X1 n=1 Tax=Tribolium castaneum TaxID=7070 RepID=UPI0030FE39DD